MLRLILFLLKCTVGILATLGLLLVLVAVVGWLFWKEVEEWRSARLDPLPERIVLNLDTFEGLRDGPAEGPLALAGLDGTISVRDVVRALEAGGRDPRVAGVVLRLGYGDISSAQAQELAAAIRRFRDSGRFAWGFAESFGEAGDGNEHYHLATALDEIWMQPSGDLDLVGYRMEQPFVRELLDDWDVIVRAGQRQQWKGLADIVRRREMAEPVQANRQALVDSLFDQLAGAVAEGRSLSVEAARNLIDRGPYTAPQALQAGLVDRLGYRDAFDEAAMEAAGEGAGAMAIGRYLSRRVDPGLPEKAPRIALLHLQGPIMLGSEDGALGASPAGGVQTLLEGLEEAAEDESVKAAVVRIDSPGGSAVASDMLWRAVHRLREAGKPVIVSLGSVAASGGYYVAVAGEQIFAQPGSLTGSIGVAGGKPVLEHFWPHLGIDWDGVQAGANAGIWHPNQDFSPAQWRRFQEGLDRTYAEFVSKVAEGRGLEGEALDAAVGGRIFTGRDALEAGLVDELGGLWAAVQAARAAAGIPQDRIARVVSYPDRGRSLRRLAEGFLRGGVGQEDLRTALLVLERAAPLLSAFERLGSDPRSRSLEAVPALQP